MDLVDWGIVFAGSYAALGLVFGLLFVARGVQVVDPAAEGSPWRFRLLILPGVATLWPVMLRQWLRARQVGA